MTRQNFFNQSLATDYDTRNSRFQIAKDHLHDLMSLIFADLPTRSHILCVGAGTGAELLYLAKQFPEWHFTVVEPAASMMEVCQRKAADSGITSRCDFHTGYIDEINSEILFDAATSILVSQFMTDVSERKAFFKKIYCSLRPQGILITADLAADTQSLTYQSLLPIFAKNFGAAQGNALQLHEAYTTHVGVLSQEQTESIIEAAGFQSPLHFFQSLLIHGWMAVRQR